MVTSGLAGAVGAVGLVDVLFCERGRRGREAAVHLVGGDVQKAERRLPIRVQAAAIGARAFQQAVGAHNVGGDEILGAMDRTVDMTLGGKVDDGARAALGQQPRHQRGIADVALHKDMALIALQRLQVGQIAGVGELVEVQHGFVGLGQPVQNEVAANETRAPSNENHVFFSSTKSAKRLACQAPIISPSSHRTIASPAPCPTVVELAIAAQ